MAHIIRARLQDRDDSRPSRLERVVVRRLQERTGAGVEEIRNIYRRIVGRAAPVRRAKA